jgi:two-component SAPR family response regulator
MAGFKLRYISSLGKFNLVINGISYLLKPQELESLNRLIGNVNKENKENK